MMALVTQETVLFNDTIATTFRTADPMRRMGFAHAQVAYAAEFIDDCREVRHIVGERGIFLSGGQRSGSRSPRRSG